MRARILFAALLGLAAASSACKKEDPPASYPPSAAPSPPTYPAPVGAPSTPAPAPAPVTGAAALGLPCASDQDLQCPFAHCAANRCGGCTNDSACKPGSRCFPTFLGYACFPAGTAAPPQAGAPPPQANTPPLSTPAPAAPGNAADPLDAARARCVLVTNEYRARVARSPLIRRSDREACGDTQAQSDGATNAAHGAFGRCQESAQNECPNWPGPIEQTVDKCLEQMFAEGPGPFSGHGHYLNMIDPSYHGVACGITTLANGRIWIVQDFYR